MSKTRIASILAVILLPLGLITTAFSAPAFASTQTEYCATSSQFIPLSPCADEYNNGGGVVASYAPGNTYEDFDLQGTGVSGQFQMVAPSGFCIGDYGNSQTDAVVGDTESCPSSGVAGWGTIYTVVQGQCPTGAFALLNKHWDGFLGGAQANGSTWYQNNNTSLCYTQF